MGGRGLTDKCGPTDCPVRQGGFPQAARRKENGSVVSGLQVGQAPFMGEIIVPETEGLPGSVNDGHAGEIYTYLVPVLICGQHFIYGNGDQFPGFVAEPESHWCNLTVCVGAGNHLYRHVDA